jgi:hypothetical protein
MRQSHLPDIDTWLDEEISSLVETVESPASLEPSSAPRVRRRVRPPRARLHELGRAIAARRAGFLYFALAVALGAAVGWLAVTMLTP